MALMTLMSLMALMTLMALMALMALIALRALLNSPNCTNCAHCQHCTYRPKYRDEYYALFYGPHGPPCRYRPETCCVIGNYYSLKAEHEKAVTYFRRALKLNRHFLSAWTLMGHEFVELKNTAAAVDAYRHAVDINPKDYRAWYGASESALELVSDGHPLFELPE